jgi:hypothetical protein
MKILQAWLEFSMDMYNVLKHLGAYPLGSITMMSPMDTSSIKVCCCPGLENGFTMFGLTADCLLQRKPGSSGH